MSTRCGLAAAHAALVLVLLLPGCQAPRTPAPPPPTRPTTTPSPHPQPVLPTAFNPPTAAPAATLPMLPTPTQTTAPCAPVDTYQVDAEYLGGFAFDLLGMAGRTGVITDTRILIRSAPVPGSSGAIQFAFWFQGPAGGDGLPYLMQLRVISTASCLTPGSGAGRASVVPAPQPDDFLVPPSPLGESSVAGLGTRDPYDFRLYLRDADGTFHADGLPGEYGFVTGGDVRLDEYGAGLTAWHAAGMITVTLALASGQVTPPFNGRFDAIRP